MQQTTRAADDLQRGPAFGSIERMGDGSIWASELEPVEGYRRSLLAETSAYGMGLIVVEPLPGAIFHCPAVFVNV